MAGISKARRLSYGLATGDRETKERVRTALRVSVDVTRAAKRLGVARSTLYKWLQEYPELGR